MKITDLEKKKKQLDALRPLSPALVKNLEDWFRVELTYTSNAMEGNTLSRRETAVVLEKGITIGGKTMVEHLEATNHAEALDALHRMQRKGLSRLEEADILFLHNVILKGIDSENAGRYRQVPVRISGSAVVLPNAAKVGQLMAGMVQWLASAPDIHPVARAAEAHYRLVTIHPFTDGNGRTARLLMNLILLMHGYPPAIIQIQDRLAYISGLETAQLGGSKIAYEKLVYKAVGRSLDIYLRAAKGKTATDVSLASKYLKIGQLAKATGETVPTIRFWTTEGLLEVAELTASRYQLYAPEMIERCRKIQQLKKRRMTLREIKIALRL